MPGPWITDDTLRMAMAATLSVDEADLAADPNWVLAIAEGNETASATITSALIGRGYTIVQVDAWDRRIEFNKALGRYWAFLNKNAAGTYNDTLIKAFNRAAELEKIPIMIGGVLGLPGGSDPDGSDPTTTDDDIDGGGAASGGRMNQDFFNFRLDRSF